MHLVRLQEPDLAETHVVDVVALGVEAGAVGLEREVEPRKAFFQLEVVPVRQHHAAAQLEDADPAGVP
jgi:hypothetical protein